MRPAGLERATYGSGSRIFNWPNNGLRHSYASYHLAQFKSADSLALELGHSGTDIIFRHYRQVVKPTAAQRYWEIMPRDRNAKVVNFPKRLSQLSQWQPVASSVFDQPSGDSERDSAPNHPTHFDQYAAGPQGESRLAMRTPAPTLA